MNPTSPRELLLQQLRKQMEVLPATDAKRALISDILDDKPEAADAQRLALRRIALERYHALAHDDPLREVLGRVLGEGAVPQAPALPDRAATLSHADPWDAIHALQRGQESLLSGLKTIDSRATAAMQESQRLAAKAVELQEFLNIVLEEVHQNTQMLKRFHTEPDDT